MDSNAVKSYISPLQATKYGIVASTCLLVWDMALTLDEEIDKIWKTRKTFGNILFFINRYMPPAILVFDLYSQFAPSPSEKFCKNYQLSSTILDIISIAVVESILLLRTHALYQSKAILMALSTLCVITMGVMLSCFMILFEKETFGPASVLGLPGCISRCLDPMFCRSAVLPSFWVPFFVYETVIFVLTIFKSYKTYKESNYPKRLSRDTTPALLQILVRDGVLYYLVIMSISLCNLLVWALYPGSSYLVIGLLKSLQAIICSRFLLNLRRPVNNTWMPTSETTAEVELHFLVTIDYDVTIR